LLNLDKTFFLNHTNFHKNLLSLLNKSFYFYESKEHIKSIDSLFIFQYQITWHMDFEERYFFNKRMSDLIDHNAKAVAYKVVQYQRDHALLKKNISELLVALFSSEEKGKTIFMFVGLIDLLEHHDEREKHGYLSILEKKLSLSDLKVIDKAFAGEQFELKYEQRIDSKNLISLCEILNDTIKTKNSTKLLNELKGFDNILLSKASSQLNSIKDSLETIEQYKILKKVYSLLIAYIRKIIENESYKNSH
jgi:hypothetical protein